jgi:CheY-like chemotaxis protein
MSSFNENLRESAVFNFSNAVTMVVDDSPFGLDLTAEALRGFGIQVRYACHSAADAIEVLKDHTVDLLLVDCEMPGMDGHELVRWIRNSGLEPNAYIPIIMTAGHVRKSKVGAVRDCGANYLVTKPFSAASLLERLIWVARDGRPFLEVGDYKGPDRRQRDSIPREEDERRSDMIALMQHKARTLAEAIEKAETL